MTQFTSARKQHSWLDRAFIGMGLVVLGVLLYGIISFLYGLYLMCKVGC